MKRKAAIILITFAIMIAAISLAACEDTYYTVDFVVDNIVLDTVEIKEGSLAALTKDEPTKEGYTFAGWYADKAFDTKWDLSADKIIAETSLYAKWDINQYTITYHGIEGIPNQNPTAYNIESGKITLGEISKPEHLFEGWYSDAELTKKVTEISKSTTGNLDIYAKLTSFFKSGTGTPSDPLVLSTKFHLENFKNKVEEEGSSDLHVKLAADIDLGGEEWKPIEDFAGVFDGGGYKISNFKITAMANMYVGLFGFNTGTIKNLGVTAIAISVVRLNTSNGDVYAGGIVGHNTGIITNCYTSGSISAKSTACEVYAGGLAGYSSIGKITYSHSNVQLTATASLASAGGLVGYSDSEINNCYATGKVTVTSTGTLNYGMFYQYSGGLVGESQNTITNSYSTGDVNVSSTYKGDLNFEMRAGGFVGQSSGVISSCFSTGELIVNTIRTNVVIGGFVGQQSEEIINCYAEGIISINSTSEYDANIVYVGGFVGYGLDSITNCYSTTSILADLYSARIYAGGFAGVIDFAVNCYAVGNVLIMVTDFDLYNIRLGGFSGNMYNLLNSYRFSEQIIGLFMYDMPWLFSTNSYGIVGSASDFASAEFYTDTLDWDGDVWDFDGTLSITSGPKLKAFA